jgi:hypothetical protein
VANVSGSLLICTSSLLRACEEVEHARMCSCRFGLFCAGFYAAVLFSGDIIGDFLSKGAITSKSLKA